MKILVYDHALNLELALKLALSGHHVGYHTPWATNSPRYADARIGAGFDNLGLERIDYFWHAVPNADLICFFDAFDGNLVDYLRQQGKKVWGGGFGAELLEQDRACLKVIQKEAGLSIGQHEVVVGVENLLERLKLVKDVYVKFSTFREVETFHHDDWPSTLAQYVGKILKAYGTDPTLEVVLEWKLQGPECGSDVIVANGEVLSPMPYGWECKDTSYIGTIPSGNQHPEGLTKVLEGFAPYYKQATQFLSIESHLALNGTATANDVTMRTAHPVISCQMEAFTNLDKVITSLGGISPKSNVRYMAALVLLSTHNKENRTEVSFPESIRQWIKLQRCQLDRGHFYVNSGGEILGHVVGIGNTIEQAIKGIEHTVAEVKAKELTYDIDSLYKLMDETIPEGRKHGVAF